MFYFGTLERNTCRCPYSQVICSSIRLFLFINHTWCDSEWAWLLWFFYFWKRKSCVKTDGDSFQHFTGPESFSGTDMNCYYPSADWVRMEERIMRLIASWPHTQRFYIESSLPMFSKWCLSVSNIFLYLAAVSAGSLHSAKMCCSLLCLRAKGNGAVRTK